MQLPIEQIAPRLKTGLGQQPNFVLQAEPGAGKTTRVPLWLLEAGVADRGDILIAQPRRLAARLAAGHVAHLLGEPVGQRCGYQVRFDSKVGAKTKIKFVTEGLLTRRLRDNPTLEGVSAVVLDEFHERHIDTDVALTLLRRLQRTSRPELRIGVMSATLDPTAVAAYLDCPALHCPGRTYPVEIEFAERTSDRALGNQVAAALHKLSTSGLDGSVLVFLPGSAEIRACARSCEGMARSLGLELVILHGELPAKEQDRAVAAGKPKLILSTNVAETSVTIEGVAAVIDSGLVRRPSHNPWTGIATLSLADISKASADQRAGRAGRTRAGRCLRLYTKHDYARRPDFDEPELARLDLAEAMLDLRAAGVNNPETLEWFSAPPPAALQAAEDLLRRIGAVASGGELTTVGRRMLSLPLHPRLSRMLVEAQQRNIAEVAVVAAALLSERPIRRRRDHDTNNDRVAAADVIADIEDLQRLQREGTHAAAALGLDLGACKGVERVRSQLARQLRVPNARIHFDPAHEEPLGYALLAGFCDRVGRLRKRSDGELELVFAQGGSAQLAPQCVVRDADYAIALGVQERRGGTRGPRTLVHSAAAVEADWLLDLFVDELVEHTEVSFDAKRERVEAVDELLFGALVIDRTVRRDVPPEAAQTLFDAAIARGAEHFVADRDNLIALRSRTIFAHKVDARIPIVDDSWVQKILRQLCDGCRSFAELRKANLDQALQHSIPPEADAALRRVAPTHVPLAGGRRLEVHYEVDRDPWVQSRLQDFFGSAQGPAVGNGHVPVVLHLLAPNQRAVQVTKDLAGFWERHYPELRRALMRRYPRHSWPDDPLSAAPPPPRPHRKRRRR